MTNPPKGKNYILQIIRFHFGLELRIRINQKDFSGLTYESLSKKVHEKVITAGRGVNHNYN